MTRNIGHGDETIRLAGGLVLLLMTLIGTGNWRWLGLMGLPLLMTAIVRVCPLYRILGIDTRKEK